MGAPFQTAFLPALDHAQSALSRFLTPDGAYVVTDGHIMDYLTLIEHGYTVDRSKPWVQLIPPVGD